MMMILTLYIRDAMLYQKKNQFSLYIYMDDDEKNSI